ncbi:hypothetical protein [Streptomyces sp. NPDC014676]|uniref:hypothetical protein n=1 Tax=Streptomyces sp. NPDC014676 TaxID=3364879 RepID=UPI0036F86F5D
MFPTRSFTHHQRPRTQTVSDQYQRALDLDREFGDRYGETEILCHLGDTHLATDDLDAALLAWQHALKIADEIGHPAADDLRGKLGDLARDTSDAGTGRRTGN